MSFRSARPQPTMADVARKAGVSPMTVSRALKDGGPVSPEARRKVHAAIDELGYVLDMTAGTLSTKRSGFIAALVPSINNSNFSDTARGITEKVAAAGLHLLLGYTDYSVETEEQLIEAMLRRRPEGLMVTGHRHTTRARRLMAAAGIPVVETWDLPPEPLDHAVGFSNAEAIRHLVHHLDARGYRRIAFIGGATSRDTRGADRRLGYVQAVAAIGRQSPRCIAVGKPPISMEQGAEAVVQLMATWPDTDAVICVSDLSAFGALMECHRRGWAVPDRLAVAGFGDFEVARCCHPRLTTVSVEALEIGRTTGALLLRAIMAAREGRILPPEALQMPFRVIPRESS